MPGIDAWPLPRHLDWAGDGLGRVARLPSSHAAPLNASTTQQGKPERHNARNGWHEYDAAPAMLGARPACPGQDMQVPAKAGGRDEPPAQLTGAAIRCRFLPLPQTPTCRKAMLRILAPPCRCVLGAVDVCCVDRVCADFGRMQGAQSAA
jgi:hypothetical protein